ncbi:MAG TPA: type II toxin-antitoxin system RelE/ParE family toxin [Nocardioidaceae bacterium]|nr:type II toxin-antitoxin system RelE/ParE family toxin [Nocardioidaceae bacterium]
MIAPYVVRITARADRDLRRLPEKVATACVEFIYGALAENPHRVGKPLKRELAGLHVARRGDYRVVFAIVEDDRAIAVFHIDRRSDIYR